MRELLGLKICFLAASLGQGGAERQLFYSLQALRRSGALPRLLCLGHGEFWEERIKNLGVPVIFAGQAKSKLGRLFQIMVELRKDPPAIFHSQHFYTSAYVGVAGRLLRLPAIGSLRSNGIMDVQDSGPIGGWLSLHFPKLITANSHAAMRYALERGIAPGRLHFLPNIVDTEKFKPTACRSDSSVRLIIIGSLIQCKRFDRFLSVLARLRKEMKQRITGLIVGAGPLKAQLERQAQALGLLPSAVEFSGSVPDVAVLYQTADICVLTSDFEGTPNVLLEAMASGLAVVATKIGGVPDIVRQGENGFVVEPGNEEDLCAALASLINNSQLRSEMGQKGRDYVEANHSLKRLPGMLGDLYQLALS